MSTYLFTITATFSIPARGIILAPGLSQQQAVRIGAIVEVRNAAGIVITSRVTGIELPNFALDLPPGQRTYPIVGATLDAAESMIGMDVWRVD